MKASEFVKVGTTPKGMAAGNIVKKLADTELTGEALEREVFEHLWETCLWGTGDMPLDKTVKQILQARERAHKANTKGIIYIRSSHKGHSTIYAGTIEHLIDDVFGYSLECGHSWNERIPVRPKTKTSLVNALNKSADECRRYHDYYALSSEEEYNAAGGKLSYEYGGNTLSGSVSVR